MTFRDKLIDARLAQNLSQAELAEKVGVSERSIYSYEEEGTSPRKTTLGKIAEALNVSVEYLTDGDEATPNADISTEEFLANAKIKYGARGAREAQEILNKATALFAGGELNDEAKEDFFKSLMEVYVESKAEAREKYTTKQRKKRAKEERHS